MFTSQHYVPIMRWKQSERDALRGLAAQDRDFITPLVELIMPRPKQHKDKDRKIEKTPTELFTESLVMLKDSLKKIPHDIYTCWGRKPIFVDPRFIDGSVRASTLEEVLALGEQNDLFLIPVVTIVPVIDFESDKATRDIAISYAKSSKKGLCLRLSRSNLTASSLKDDINSFIKLSGLSLGEIDLLADFELVDENYLGLVGSLKNIPSLTQWRTFTLASGTFPMDLTQLAIGDHEIQRLEWINWKNSSLFSSLERQPSFSDYTIQHPVYKEPPRISFPSASIRYTLPDSWLVMRGQGGPNSPRGQYLDNASLLKNDPRFLNLDCEGDKYISEKAKDLSSPKTGSPKTWLVAGFNHHLTLVARQLASLLD